MYPSLATDLFFLTMAQIVCRGLNGRLHLHKAALPLWCHHLKALAGVCKHTSAFLPFSKTFAPLDFQEGLQKMSTFPFPFESRDIFRLVNKQCTRLYWQQRLSDFSYNGQRKEPFNKLTWQGAGANLASNRMAGQSFLFGKQVLMPQTVSHLRINKQFGRTGYFCCNF